MLVLGIETTCDETAAAVVERQSDGSGKILSNIVRSQTSEHARFGGVVPEIAARAHVDLLDGIVGQAMKDANTGFAQLSAGAPAAGPGLVGGGMAVERRAASGDAKRVAFRRPMIGRPDANFSLSGLKTAVRNEASRLMPLEPQDVSDLCAGFQAAVLESTADRLSVGLRLFHEQFGPPRALVAAGGVAANQAIRGALQDVAEKAPTKLIIPPPALCTDNCAIIAWAGAERLALGMIDTMDAAPRARWLLDANATARGGFSNTRAGF